MTENPEYQLTTQGSDAVENESLRGKSIAPDKISPPPADLMARYCFRAWTEEDAPTYRKMLDDAELWRYMHEDFPDEVTLVLAKTLIELSRQASHHKVRAVEYKGQLIGQVRMHWVTERTPPQSGELSYWLGRDYWGCGLSAPMVALFSWRCFSIFPALGEMKARVHQQNTASHHVLRRLGWSEIGPETGQPDWLVYRLSRADGVDWTRLEHPRHRSSEQPG